MPPVPSDRLREKQDIERRKKANERAARLLAAETVERTSRLLADDPPHDVEPPRPTPATASAGAGGAPSVPQVSSTVARP